jgi:hypothetical protein
MTLDLMTAAFDRAAVRASSSRTKQGDFQNDERGIAIRGEEELTGEGIHPSERVLQRWAGASSCAHE